MSADTDLAAFAARLRGLKALTAAAAAEAAPLVAAEVQRTAAAGTDSYGKPWPPKKDGTRALPNAASAITAAAVGALVIVKLLAPYSWHQKAKPADRHRQILPDAGAGIPPSIVAALREGVARAARRLAA